MRVALLVLFSSMLPAATLVRELTYNPNRFSLAQRQAYDLVLADGMDVTDEPGAPQLPVQPVVIALPGRCRVRAVGFDRGSWEPFTGSFLPLPAQRQRVLVDTSALDAFTAPDPVIYASDAAWPVTPARWTGTSYQGDSTLVQVLVCPVRYIGAERQLEICRTVAVHIEYEPLGVAGGVRRMANDELDSPGFDYLIVTAAGYDTVFRRLADWKTKKGVKAVVRDIAGITGTYPGRDDAEKLRNYLKTLPDSGVRYVLLGGDVSVVPFRKAFAMRCDWGGHNREDSLPCDLYFADLDGSWDATGNNVFGETADSVDLYADLHVGRAPVDRLVEARAFVNKVINYERGVVAGYQNKVLFFAEVLWQNPYTDGGVHKNMMERQSFRSGYSVTKLYQSLGNESRASVMNAIRQNQNFLNHDGHGWIDVMSCGSGPSNYLRTGDADTITNSGHGVLFSIGCWTTAFDFTSIGEAFVANPNGGTVATVGNSSYGWGSPGNPGFGYSDKFDNRFWHAITSEGHHRLGDALGRSKEYYVPFSHDRNVYRWHQYQLNLMGDPELAVWTTLPQPLTVTAPPSIGLGRGRYLVTVSRAGAPAGDALVCLARPGEVYARARCDAAGRAWLEAETRTAGQLSLTVTAANCYPYESSVTCDSGVCVNFAGWSVNDSSGNNDGIANPCETVLLPTWLANTGNQSSGALELRLRTSNPHVTILDSAGSCAGLEPGDSLLLAQSFRVAIAPGTPDDEAVRFDLAVSSTGPLRVFTPVLLVGEPLVGYNRHWVVAPPLLPGQTKGLRVRLWNSGHGIGHAAWTRLVSLDSHISVPLDSVGYGAVAALSFAVSPDSFLVTVGASCPAGYLAEMLLVTHADRYFRADTFGLLVGPSGFADDMESGGSLWTHGGSGDQWHISAHRTHSGSSSWYCGDAGSRRYANNVNAWLMTVPLVAAEHCSLSFWRWFKVPNYGVDGIYVVVVRGSHEDTLDFIGTGGALGRHCAKTGTVPVRRNAHRSGDSPSLSQDIIESSWAQERYDLSFVGVGETIRVKLSFKSDRDTVDEGFYVDDVVVTGGLAPIVGVLADAPEPTRARLSVQPNPFRQVAVVQTRNPGVVAVYDAAGREVNVLTLVNGRAVWDGRDRSGTLLPAGAYFVRPAGTNELARTILVR
ncbi:hypothetical protein FJY69_00525 [candidate division WOR-3 bacterium]|nr:hypothetical protein [candidate division WOR-3 bacterium]